MYPYFAWIQEVYFVDEEVNLLVDPDEINEFDVMWLTPERQREFETSSQYLQQSSVFRERNFYTLLTEQCPNLSSLCLGNVSLSGLELSVLLDNLTTGLECFECAKLVTTSVSSHGMPVPVTCETLLRLRRFCQLKSLTLGLATLDDETMCILVRGLPRLMSLRIEVYDTANFSDASLFEIAKSCPELRNFLLGLPLNDVRISDDGLLAICRSCSLLTNLTVMGSVITDEGVRLFGECCRNLNTLNLSHNDLITSAPLEERELWERMPKLQFIVTEDCHLVHAHQYRRKALFKQ
jgi:hypothetical protein